MKREKVEELLNALTPVIQKAEPDVKSIKYFKWNVYEEIAVIHYKNGHFEAINISCNSLSATLKEVVKLTTERDCYGWIKEIPDSLKEIIESMG